MQTFYTSSSIITINTFFPTSYKFSYSINKVIWTFRTDESVERTLSFGFIFQILFSLETINMLEKVVVARRKVWRHRLGGEEFHRQVPSMFRESLRNMVGHRHEEWLADFRWTDVSRWVRFRHRLTITWCFWKNGSSKF